MGPVPAFRCGSFRPQVPARSCRQGSVVKHRISILGVLAAIALVALASGCGGSSSGGREGGTLKATFSAFPDYMDPALSHTGEGWTATWNTYIPLLTYAHASGKAGSKVIPGLAKAMPEISNGGKTYTLTLRKGLRYSDGTPVKASDFPYTVERVFKLNSERLPLLHGHRRRRRVRRNEAGRDPGDRDRRQDRRDRHRTGRTERHLHQRAGAAVRRARPHGHADRRPLRRPAARHRPLRDRQVAAGQRLGIRAQPAVDEANGEADAGTARRPDGQDRGDGDPQPLGAGRRHRTGHLRLDGQPAAGRSLCDGQGRVRGHPVQGRGDREHLLLLDEHDAGAVRRPARCARRSTSRSTRKRWNGSTPASWSAASRSCRPGCPATKSSTSTRPTSPRRRSCWAKRTPPTST